MVTYGFLYNNPKNPKNVCKDVLYKLLVYPNNNDVFFFKKNMVSSSSIITIIPIIRNTNGKHIRIIPIILMFTYCIITRIPQQWNGTQVAFQAERLPCIAAESQGAEHLGYTVDTTQRGCVKQDNVGIQSGIYIIIYLYIMIYIYIIIYICYIFHQHISYWDYCIGIDPVRYGD